MNLIKAIRIQASTGVGLTIIRADQTGELPDLPYATYKIISSRKGTGRKNIEHIDKTDLLIEQRSEERNTTISFNVYGTSHDNAYETAEVLRKWFDYKGDESLEQLNVSIVNIEDVTNRSVFLVNAYDEKYGFDVIIRYIDSDELEIDYFEKVESEIIIERE